MDGDVSAHGAGYEAVKAWHFVQLVLGKKATECDSAYVLDLRSFHSCLPLTWHPTYIECGTPIRSEIKLGRSELQMKTFIASTPAVLLGACLLLSPVAADAGQKQSWLRMNENSSGSCDNYASSSHCGGRKWSHQDSGWNDHRGRDTHRLNRHHRSYYGNDGGDMFMFSFGSSMGYPRHMHGNSSHVSDCVERYSSYQIRTDSFLGYDGYWHRCML